MNKKLSILLFVGVIAVVLFSYGVTKMDDPQPVTSWTWWFAWRRNQGRTPGIA